MQHAHSTHIAKYVVELTDGDVQALGVVVLEVGVHLLNNVAVVGSAV
jgi:hypothetical protein